MSVSSILAFSSAHIFVRRLEGLEKDFNPIETYLLKNYLDSADNDYKLLFSIWRSKMTTYGGPFTDDYLHWHNPLTEGRQLQKGWSLVSTVTSVKIAIIATYWLKAWYSQLHSYSNATKVRLHCIHICSTNKHARPAGIKLEDNHSPFQ